MSYFKKKKIEIFHKKKNNFKRLFGKYSDANTGCFTAFHEQSDQCPTCDLLRLFQVNKSMDIKGMEMRWGLVSPKNDHTEVKTKCDEINLREQIFNVISKAILILLCVLAISNVKTIRQLSSTRPA